MKNPKFIIGEIVIIDPSKRFSKKMVKEMNEEHSLATCPFVQARIVTASHSIGIAESKKVPLKNGWVYTVELPEPDEPKDLYFTCAEDELIKIK